MTSNRERNDLIISWLTVSLAFAWIGTEIFTRGGLITFISQFIIMLVAVGTGFILHELAHKYVGIHYGAKAEFRAWKQGLLLAIGLAVLTNGAFVFAAPGAVYVYGKNISVKQNGIISLAGPVTNILIAITFGILIALVNPEGLGAQIMVSTVYVNFFLAAFNMLPVFPLDGSKVFVWSKTTWITTMAIAVAGALFFPHYLTTIF